MDDRDLIKKIRAIKKELGQELLILTHHYQRKDIVDLGDRRGDSFDLSQKAAADEAARYIVFCGVHFMAESAEILVRPYQTVQIPDRRAGCPMADMANIETVERAWEELAPIAGSDTIVPIVYMNSDAELKAFAGREGGIVCTSSNARAAMEWAFRQGEKILFFPDQHLGRNTGNQMGIAREEMILWRHEEPLGGNSPEALKRARLILWDGYCLVHTRFQAEHIHEMRKRLPEARIVVHPECTEVVVNLADAVGSTSFIVRYVEDAPEGSTIIIGTEINLIERLGLEYPGKEILPLTHSLCSNMYKIDLKKLLGTLENIGRVNVVKVPEEIKVDARKALNRMLDL